VSAHEWSRLESGLASAAAAAAAVERSSVLNQDGMVVMTPRDITDIQRRSIFIANV